MCQDFGARQILRRCCVVLGAVLAAGLFLQADAYSVLSHEAIIDAAWDSHIRPLLLQRFPNATEDELREAHGYAYGGAIIQDLGYYPHGTHYFSDLTHYVRSGDFVLALLQQARDIDEYAFALGALAHYAADEYGHRIGVNASVPLLYPKLERKYGNWITYEDNPAAHLKTEFGFDVLQVAKERYAPQSYHDFIGFNVATSLLERAFQDTYSVPLRSVFPSFEISVNSYRYDVHTLIPEATKVAWVLKNDEIRHDQPGITKRRFLYNLSRASFRKEWGRDYQAPGFGTRFLAFIVALIPKIGPLRALSLRLPTPEAEKRFMASFNVALTNYRRLLEQERDGTLVLPNINFDTGTPTQPGTYFMADDAYAELVNDLAKDRFRSTSGSMRSDILAYYQNGDATLTNKKRSAAWKRLNAELNELRALSSKQTLSEIGQPDR